MQYDYYIDEEKNLIFCSLRGELDVDVAIKLSRKLRTIASEHSYAVLYDAYKLEEPNSSTPVHDLTVKLSSIIDKTVHHSVRVALLYEEGNFDNYWKFYEDLALQRGLPIRVFTCREDATNWLSNEPIPVSIEH